MHETGQGYGGRNAQMRTAWNRVLSRRLLGVGALAMVALILIATSPWLRHQLTLSFTRQPDSYTELYFSGSQPVFGTGIAEQQVTVNFVVVNHENGPIRYPYLVRVLDSAGRPLAQRTDSISVADGEQRPTQVTLAVPAASTWSTVDVQLLNRPEVIHYMVPNARTPGT